MPRGDVSGVSAQERSADPDYGFSVVGSVIDEETRAPLVGAIVKLNDSEWGMLTNDAGNFSLVLPRPGFTRIEVSMLGYSDLVWEGVVNPGDRLAVELKPQPILLEGLEIVFDRFRSRRKAVARPVRAFEREDLALSPFYSVLDLIEGRGMAFTTACRNTLQVGPCVWIRGQSVEPTVYIDEMPMPGGMHYLSLMAPQELEMLEIYGNGRHIRAYTPRYMERAARIRLFPIPIF